MLIKSLFFLKVGAEIIKQVLIMHKIEAMSNEC